MEFNEYITMDISMETLYEQLSDDDKDLLIEFFIEDGTIKKTDVNYIDKTIGDMEFDEILSKLSDIRFRMDPEDEEIIKNIAKKY